MVEELKKLRAQISNFSFLLSFEEHRDALLKVLSESHEVSDGIEMKYLENIVVKLLPQIVYFTVDKLTPKESSMSSHCISR